VAWRLSGIDHSRLT